MTRPCVYAQSAAMAFLLVLAIPRLSHAAWPNDSLLNVPVCTAQNDQSAPASVGDGNGGVIVAWIDARGGVVDGDFVDGVYAQHVLGSGTADPAWPADGRFLCQPSPLFREQQYASIVSDGADGAIVVWQEKRSFVQDVYAQHVQANGDVDPAWPVNGLRVSASSTDHYYPKSVTDGAGGAIVAWQDGPSGNADICAQHVRLGGTVDPAWPVHGSPVCAASNSQEIPELLSDGAGGAIVTWNDYRTSYPNIDIYAQHVLANGTMDPNWTVNGIVVSQTATVAQQNPKITSDGAAGAIIVWWDNQGAGADVYAQHVLAGGTLDPAWPATGRAVCAAAGDQLFPAIVADSSGGAIVSWVDARPSRPGVYAHHVLATGALDPAWPAGGRVLSPNANVQPPAMVSDTLGGAIVVWTDYRSDDGSHTNGNLYAQRVRASGDVDPMWPAGGRALCAAPRDQVAPTVIADGAGGAIAAWQDYRAGSSDIYASRVQANGKLGGDATRAALLVDITSDGQSVRVRWLATGMILGVRIYRRTVDTDWLYVDDVPADGSGLMTYDDHDVWPGRRYGYRTGVASITGEEYFGEAWITVPAPKLVLDGPRPNPADRELAVTLSALGGTPAVLELIDLSGRSLMRQTIERSRAWSASVNLDVPGGVRSLAPGVYLLRVTQGDQVVMRKACILH